MRMHATHLTRLTFGTACALMVLLTLIPGSLAKNEVTLDQQLEAVLKQEGFTGKIESTLERRLGRHLNNDLADLGRLLFFDTVGALNNDNNCSGCHSPTNGFGDTQSIAIGIDNNGIVGPRRSGPSAGRPRAAGTGTPRCSSSWAGRESPSRETSAPTGRTRAARSASRR